MRRTFTDRLARIARRNPPSGRLPVILIAPDGPDGDAVRQQAERLRARGQQVILIGPDGDALAELVEAFVP